MTPYNIFLISNNLDALSDIECSISPEHINYFDGTGYESFSKLVNSCVASSLTETVIIASTKVRPTQSDVQKILSLLNEGYGFVGLYRFAFFGLNKELFRRIGMMDERFLHGGYEDDDFYLRLREANIAMYVTEEVKYFAGKSSWKHDVGRSVYSKKWAGIGQRQFSEEIYTYNLGDDTHQTFLTSEHDFITAPHTLRRLQVLSHD
jgi:hypothetical protein